MVKLTKKCQAKHCAAPDFDYYNGNNKLLSSDLKKGKVRRVKGTEAFVYDDEDMCDFCLLKHYNLEPVYDSEDGEGTIELYRHNAVIKALRNARKGN